jgi:hypothetical protein
VNAQHSNESVDWGTPTEILDIGRRSLGVERYDFDAYSSSYWNRWTVQARRFRSAEDPARGRAWEIGPGYSVNCNPAGGFIVEAWMLCVAAWRAGAGVFWTGFSLEQLPTICQPIHAALRPEFRRVILPARLAFLKPGATPDDPPVASTAPSHGNYLVLMARHPRQIERFDEACRARGAVPF